MTDSGPGILTLAYFFDPADAVGAQRPWRFHRYLPDAGYASYVVAAFAPANAGARVHVVADDAGAFWDKRLTDRTAGKQTDPMPLPCHIERLLKRTVWPGQFALSWSRAAARCAAGVVLQNPNITTILSTFPPIGGHLAAMKVTRANGLRWIADFRDPFLFGDTRLGHWGIGQLERLVFRRADAIIANTEAAAAGWRRKFPWAAGKLHVIWNGYDPEQQINALPIPQRPYRSMVHAGSLYAGRNANAIIRGFTRLYAKNAIQNGAVRVLLAGKMDETASLDRQAYDRAADDAWLQLNTQGVSKQEAERITREADYLLLLQPQSAVQVPAKLFDYLSIGRPILALVPRSSSIEWILENAGVPFVCVYADDNDDTVDRKLRSFLALPVTATPANDWFRNNFDGRRQTQQLAALIDQVNAGR